MVSKYMLCATYSFLPDACRVRFLFSFINTIAYGSVTFESFYVSWKSFPCLGRKALSVAGLPVIMGDRVIDQMVPSCLFLPWFKKYRKNTAKNYIILADSRFPPKLLSTDFQQHCQIHTRWLEPDTICIWANPQTERRQWKKGPNQHALRTCKNTRIVSFWESHAVSIRFLCWQHYLLFPLLYELILNYCLHCQRSGKICTNGSEARNIFTARMIIKWLLCWIQPEIGLPRTSLWYQAGSRCLRSIRWGHTQTDPPHGTALPDYHEQPFRDFQRDYKWADTCSVQLVHLP